MKIERSAGFVVYRSEADAPHGRLYLLLDYGRFWDYPKGHVEAGEDLITAARRELLEETGIEDVELVPGFAHEIVYFFRDKRAGLIRKHVTFFLGRTEASEVQISHEHAGHAFLPFNDALERVTYQNAKQVLRLAHEYLETQAAA